MTNWAGLSFIPEQFLSGWGFRTLRGKKLSQGQSLTLGAAIPLFERRHDDNN
jgi:hypothetical protein